MLDPQLHALVRAYGARTAAIRAQTEAFVTDVWQASGSWHRGDITRIARTVAPVTEAAQHRMAALTDLYLAQVETFHSGRVVPPRGVTAGEVTSQALRGVDAVELFERTGPTVGSALAKGDTVARASGKGLQRLQKMVAANLQLSKTRTSRRVLRDSGERVVGYRRVLNGPVNCGLCVVASTQRYRRGDLLPIHPGCDCSVLPIHGDQDPGWVIDEDQLDSVHAAIEERFGAHARSAGEFRTPHDEALHYRDLLVVNEHGELGPVLGVRGQDFTAAADLA